MIPVFRQRLPIRLIVVAVFIFFRSSGLVGFEPASCLAAESTRPNIVIVLADDLSRRFIGCYGNSEVKTPNIDRLAAQGLKFNFAFTSTAMCAPTRAQLYTGLFPIRNGAFPNHSRIRAGVKTLPTYLQNLGYRVGIHGKRHYKPVSAFPFESIGNRKFSSEAISEFVNRDATQPFCLVVASDSPHVPWSAGEASVYDPTKLTLPKDYADTPETRQALARYYGEISDLDRETGECMRIVRQANAEKNTLFVFSSEQGAQFPGGKWTCYEEGLCVGLVIRWPENIKAGSTSDAWVHYVDVVPTLIDLAGGQPVAELDGKSFSKVLTGNVATHRTEVFGVHTQRGAIGSPPTGYPIRSIRIGDFKYIQNLNHKVMYNNALIQNDKEHYWSSWVRKAEIDPFTQKLVQRYTQRPAEEFFDLRNDPLEMNNLALAGSKSLAQHQTTINRMKHRLQEWMASQGDLGAETELGYQAPSRTQKKR